MNGVLKTMVGLLAACLLQVAFATTVEEARAQALSSTNYWGVSFAEYRLRLASLSLSSRLMERCRRVRPFAIGMCLLPDSPHQPIQ